MKAYKCCTRGEVCKTSCIVIVDDGDEPECCPYSVWAGRKSTPMEWDEINVLLVEGHAEIRMTSE